MVAGGQASVAYVVDLQTDQIIARLDHHQCSITGMDGAFSVCVFVCAESVPLAESG